MENNAAAATHVTYYVTRITDNKRKMVTAANGIAAVKSAFGFANVTLVWNDEIAEFTAISPKRGIVATVVPAPVV